LLRNYSTSRDSSGFNKNHAFLFTALQNDSEVDDGKKTVPSLAEETIETPDTR